MQQSKEEKMRCIRIIATPDGEAPKWVRKAWIGLTLSLLDGDFGKRGKKHGFGVLTDSNHSFFRQLMNILLGRSILYDGYAVDAVDAVKVLSESNPTAAQWWHENAPHVLAGKQAFLFEAEVCEEVDCDANSFL